MQQPSQHRRWWHDCRNRRHRATDAAARCMQRHVAGVQCSGGSAATSTFFHWHSNKQPNHDWDAPTQPSDANKRAPWCRRAAPPPPTRRPPGSSRRAPWRWTGRTNQRGSGCHPRTASGASARGTPQPGAPCTAGGKQVEQRCEGFVSAPWHSGACAASDSMRQRPAGGRECAQDASRERCEHERSGTGTRLAERRHAAPAASQQQKGCFYHSISSITANPNCRSVC